MSIGDNFIVRLGDGELFIRLGGPDYAYTFGDVAPLIPPIIGAAVAIVVLGGMILWRRS